MPPKFNVLNQLADINVCIAVPPPVNVKLGLLDALAPATAPNVYVLVISAAAVNPPVPVQVNPVTVPIFSTVEAAVVVANIILPVPKDIERVVTLSELNIPVVKLNPPKSNVPAVNVYVPVAVNAYALLNVTLPAV